jgi:RsiW-degrading membrane proteinase PrsW (M82 family)
MNEMPGGHMKNRLGSESATMSELFPVMGEKKNLLKKGHLAGAAVVLLFAIVLLSNLGNHEVFRNMLGVGVGVGVYFALYQMCGKAKPWYVIVGAGLITMVVMSSPLWNLLYTIYYGLPGIPSGDAQSLSLPELLILRIVSTGGVEELVKILPVLLFWSLGRKFSKLSVTEPLDGILLAMASALGFVFIETLGQYAHNAVAQNGQTVGLELVIVRILWAFKGHLAYSGYFGYFVGLAAMKPKHAVKLLCIGYACAATMHGFWDALVGLGLIVQLALGVTFYALLIAGVLKAREISPTRAKNFATVLVGSPVVPATPVGARAAAAAAAPAPRPQAPPPPVPQPQPRVTPHVTPHVPPPPVPQPAYVKSPAVPQPQVLPDLAVHPPAADGLKLLIGLRTLVLHDGDRFVAGEIAGLRPASMDGCVAAVNHNPQDPSILGLQNLSTNTWTAVLPGGFVREVPSGKSVKLASGSRIDFGTSQGEVQ